MASNNRSKGYMAHQIGALITLLVLAIWGLAVLWIHLVTPAGADKLQMTFIGTLTPMFLILLVNTEFDLTSPESRSLWLFASPLKLQVLLMEEAARCSCGQCQ